MPNDNPPPRRGVPQHLQGGPVRLGPYWLESRLAVGGTAEVYIAKPVDPRVEPQRLVVKRLLPHFAQDAEGRTMFEREARLHASVQHENVVTVFGSGTAEDGEPYLAMELVDGCDAYRLLRRLAQQQVPLSIKVAVHVAREVLRALASVHSAQDKGGVPLGIIHRDVTPSNLYLARDGAVKLGDFGIARSSTRVTLKSNEASKLKGKFAYLAPEQVAGEPFDHRADLFSLATVLAEMILGQPLFPGSGQLAVLLAIRDTRIDPLVQAKDKMPPDAPRPLRSARAGPGA
jgi:eukaryotic-like serine/threonine-protein kinase